MNYTEFYYGPEGIMDDRRDRGNGCDECRDENWQNMNEYDGMSERNDLHREAADFSNSRRSVTVSYTHLDRSYCSARFPGDAGFDRRVRGASSLRGRRG